MKLVLYDSFELGSNSISYSHQLCYPQITQFFRDLWIFCLITFDSSYTGNREGITRFNREKDGNVSCSSLPSLGIKDHRR